MINLQAISQLVWELRFLSMGAQSAHWHVFGPTSYSDHLLYGRVYEKLDELLDPIAERVVALSGETGFSLSTIEQANYIYRRMMESGPRLEQALTDPNASALYFYNELRILSRRMRSFVSDVAHGQTVSLGVEDLLAGTANEIETLSYFLERRSQLYPKGR